MSGPLLRHDDPLPYLPNLEPPSHLVRFIEQWMILHTNTSGLNDYVPIVDIMNGNNVLQMLPYTVTDIADEVKFAGLVTRVCCDMDGTKLRLRDETEQLRLAIEDVICDVLRIDMDLLELMRHPLVDHWLNEFGARLAGARSAMINIAVCSSDQVVMVGARIAPKQWFEPSFSPEMQAEMCQTMSNRPPKL